MASAAVVSVVIPCRDAEAWIGEAVTSAVEQDDVDVDLVVVDDGSRDRSVEVATEASRGALTLVRQRPSGVSRARNAGTRVARGAFVQYLDADDVLTRGTLAARVRALETTGADVAYCDWVRIKLGADKNWLPAGEVRRVLSERPEIELLNAAWWPPGALLYRRAIVDRILPWREDLPIVQDARFQQDAAIAGGAFVHVPGVGLAYRVHSGGSLSSRDPVAFLDDCFHSVSDLHARFASSGSLDSARRRVLARAYSHVVRGYFQHDRTKFIRALARARELDPDFVPSGPTGLKLLSRAIGYPRAERVAAGWRAVKRRARTRVSGAS